MALLSVLAGSLIVAAAAPPPLEAAIQRALDALADEGHVVQLSWKDAARDFTVSAGTVRLPGGTHRPAAAADNFLYGSVTKPFTAAAVMALVERGAVRLDDPLSLHVDPMLARMKGGTSLRSLFGEAAGQMTVEQAIGMRLGIGDYDSFGEFDDSLLLNRSVSTLAHSPVEFLEWAAKDESPCAPGACTSYSSASMILAALVAMRHQPGLTSWTDFDERWAYPDAVREADLPNSVFLTSQMVKDVLTQPGVSTPDNSSEPKQVVWEQSGSIMGVGCANIAAPTRDVARFFWDLLGPTPRVVSAASVEKMVAPLDGTDPDAYFYGLGLDNGAVCGAGVAGCGGPRGSWGTWLGHYGAVYGFSAHAGIFYGPNASLAIATNYDDSRLPPPLTHVLCAAMQAYADHVEHAGRDLQCQWD